MRMKMELDSLSIMNMFVNDLYILHGVTPMDMEIKFPSKLFNSVLWDISKQGVINIKSTTEIIFNWQGSKIKVIKGDD